MSESIGSPLLDSIVKEVKVERLMSQQKKRKRNENVKCSKNYHVKSYTAVLKASDPRTEFALASEPSHNKKYLIVTLCECLYDSKSLNKVFGAYSSYTTKTSNGSHRQIPLDMMSIAPKIFHHIRGKISDDGRYFEFLDQNKIAASQAGHLLRWKPKQKRPRMTILPKEFEQSSTLSFKEVMDTLAEKSSQKTIEDFFNPSVLPTPNTV